MKRNWCPSLDNKLNTRFDASHLGVISDVDNPRQDTPADYGAIAAHSDKSASRVAATVDAFATSSSASKFSTSVIASKYNKSLWPISFHTIPLEYLDDATLKEVDVLALGDTFLGSVVENGESIQRLAIPAEHVARFLYSVVRHEASKNEHALSDNLESLLVLPSVSTSVSSDAVFDSFLGNTNLARRLETLVLSGILCDEEEPITKFLSMYKRLRELSLIRCSLGATAAPVLELMKNGELEHVNLEGNDLGLSENEEGVREVLCEFLQRNKFLLSLNVAHNNFSADAVEAFMTALATSDTTLSPEDLPAEPEEEPRPIEDYLVSFADEEGEEEEEEAAEEDEEIETSDAKADDDDEEEEEEEEENEEEEEEAEEEEAEEEEEDEADEEDEEDEEKEKRKKATRKDKPRPLSKAEKKRELRKRQRFNARQVRALVKEESKVRRVVVNQYAADTRTVAGYMDVIRQTVQDEKKRAVAAFCARRSGWSTMKYLILRSNHVGDKGAAAVALMLRHEVSLEEEEVARIDASLREKTGVLLEALQAQRGKSMSEERKERKRLEQMLADVVAAAYKASAIEAKELDEDDDEYSRDAPQVLMTNMDEEEAKAAEADEEELEIEEPPEFELDTSEWTLNIHPLKSGMNSLLYLDLGSCDIGGKGIKSLATSLRDNKVLESIILRNNRFGVSFQKVTVEDDDNTAERRVEVPNFVSPGFIAFTEMLAVNSTLLHLDLGYCSLQPASIHLLAAALCQNKTLVTLCLEGNRIGQTVPVETEGDDADPSCLLDLLAGVSASAIQHLNLSHNELERILWQEEIDALASVARGVSSLYLNGVGLTGDHVDKWVEALGGEASSIHVLHMARNAFQTEVDGDALGRLFSICPALEELCLDDHGKLSSKAVCRALAHVPPSLTSISLNRVGISGVLDTVSLETLEYLSLSDIAIHSSDQLAAWVKYIGEQCNDLKYLSLWSRHLQMQAMLDTCCTLATTLETLQYADFGVMLRFDQQQDTLNALGKMERQFLSRRIEGSKRGVDEAEKRATPSP
ncbi:hypothetical protein STCU_00877 [Strigomonas culicis]|uniref:Uncharacterized protein n=1 Tax=Strigomonas culicis TaxID=28005 RepID=S9W9A9_9TRYP|nr:hypothetical protein STCU_00877 [Strigomonas culicis]|eukprot:EPY35856.1 hypothetical protein STCU_00877 [Strigomonas culicis]